MIYWEFLFSVVPVYFKVVLLIGLNCEIATKISRTLPCVGDTTLYRSSLSKTFNDSHYSLRDILPVPYSPIAHHVLPTNRLNLFAVTGHWTFDSKCRSLFPWPLDSSAAFSKSRRQVLWRVKQWQNPELKIIKLSICVGENKKPQA